MNGGASSIEEEPSAIAAQVEAFSLPDRLAAL
jgi:hypothetical protein